MATVPRTRGDATDDTETCQLLRSCSPHTRGCHTSRLSALCTDALFPAHAGMPLTAREAARLIKKQGGRFVRHGGRHDIYEAADGMEIQVPRHVKDLSPGVERDIKERLGLR